MNNQENNKNNNYINPKTGSGYVPAGKGSMDFSIAILLGFIIVGIIGGGILLFTNEDIRYYIEEGIEEIVESFEDTDDYYYDDYEDDYYDEYGDDYYDEEDDYYLDDLQYSIRAFKEIDARDIKTESVDKTIVVWIGRQNCSYCKLYAPVIEEVADEFDIVARYIDLAKIIDFSGNYAEVSDQIALNIISNLQGTGEWAGFAEENVSGTPLTLIIRNNEVIGGISGYTQENELIDVFLDAGLRK